MLAIVIKVQIKGLKKKKKEFLPQRFTHTQFSYLSLKSNLSAATKIETISRKKFQSSKPEANLNDDIVHLPSQENCFRINRPSLVRSWKTRKVST